MSTEAGRTGQTFKTKRRQAAAFLLLVLACSAQPGMSPAMASEGPPDFSLKAEPGEHPEDEKIAKMVEARLLKDLRIHWEVLEVKVVAGRVDLYGKVRTPEEKALAMRITSDMPGVLAVVNHLLVGPTLRDRHQTE